MKGVVLGMVGVGGVGAFAVMGPGGGPDDFIGTTSKSPQAVYAAFSDLGREGEVSLPATPGFNERIVQRVIKVPNEQVKLEVLVGDESLLSAEVQIAPEGSGSRIAAELDFNEQLINRIAREQGAPPMPTFAFQDFLIDQVFAQAMGEMVQRIEDGKPLLSLAATHDRWSSGDNGDGTFSHQSSPHVSRSPGRSARPQMDARPMLDPNAAARRGGQSSEY